jgi:alkanesulfonate monooxygenase SsuD/methylene tetrahydromethanopterin reductase-like flavin-dependent oxidoreductase (luciferase family)
MQIGILTQGFVRTDQSPQERVAQVVEQARLADEVGLASFGVSEQHFKFPTNSTGGIISIMAAVAQATSQIQITPGAVILPFHHPLNVAEEWATIDILSNGRLYFGIGKGNTPLTADVYHVPVTDTDARTQESLEIIMKAWSQERFSHQGKFFNFPEIAVCPRPVQQPMPPIGCATTSIGGAQYAGANKFGFMTGAVAADWHEIEELLSAYETAWEKGKPLGNAKPFKFTSLLVHGHVGRHIDEIRDQVAYGVVQYVNRYIEYKRVFAERTGKPNPTFGEKWLNNFDNVVEQMPSVFGTPDQAIERLLRMKKLGLDRVDITIDYAKQEELLECIRLLGKEVAPAVK